MDFYDRMKECMKSKGVTVEQMMKDVFGPHATVNQYQSIKTRGLYFRADDTLAFANYFGVSVEWLLTGEEKKDTRSPEEKMFVDLFNQLDGTAKATILTLMTQLKK